MNKNPPRIAMVSTHGYVSPLPPLGNRDTGGQVVYVIELSKKLALLGFEIDIWTRRFENQPEIEEINNRVKIIRMPCGGKEFIPKEFLHKAMPEWTNHALEFIRHNNITYQFINSHYWDAGVGARLLAQNLNVPHVFTPHSLGIWKKKQMERDFPDSQEKFEAQYNFTIRINTEKALMQEANRTIATSPLQHDMIQVDYQVPHDQLRMIPPGYDELRFFPVGEASNMVIRRRLGYQGKVVLAVGRLARNKGYDLLIDAFSVLVQRIPDAKLYLAAGGETSSSSEELLISEIKKKITDLNLTDKITFCSFIPDNELADHYRAADIFVLSSRYEPFGMTAIEAMACGTPTVITIHGGLHKAISFGRHALFADPFDKEDLGIMMTKILRHDRLRERLSKMGASRVRGLFTWLGVAQQLVAQLQEPLQKNQNSFPDDRWNEPWTDED